MLIFVFEPLEAAKLVLPSEMVLLCWWFLEVEDFHSESVVALGAMVNFVYGADLCLFANCGKSDLLHFVLHHHRGKK